MGPYTVLRLIGSIIYVLDLPNDMWISSIFNVADHLPYHTPPEDEDSGDAPSNDTPTTYSPEENFSEPRMIDTAQSPASHKVLGEIPALTNIVDHQNYDGDHDLAVKTSTQFQQLVMRHHGHDKITL